MTTLDPYKGVRDFYPEDERIQKYIFNAMSIAVERFGYEEMNASILEPTDLYTAKTSEEIVSKQTYTFIDRGDRSVTLRPEMTPTVARMVAARKRELGFPLRWYSIQNFFRYERPQRGRLREFWQLNADLFGAPGIDADVEVIEVAHAVMKALGAKDIDYVIRIGSRAFMEWAYTEIDIPKKTQKEVTRLFDKKEKVNDFEKDLSALVGKEKAASLEKAIAHPNFPYFSELLEKLQKRGLGNIVIDPNIARGFDYYTGMVFEVFDTNKANPRSMFGGGRYDNLVGQYGKEDVPAIGFAMGDVIARDFLETHKLMPGLGAYVAWLYLAPVSSTDWEGAAKLAGYLREKGVKVALGMNHQKISDHIKAAIKLEIRDFAAYGEKEKESGMLTIKTLASGEEKTLPIEEVKEYIRVH